MMAVRRDCWLDELYMMMIVRLPLSVVTRVVWLCAVRLTSVVPNSVGERLQPVGSRLGVGNTLAIATGARVEIASSRVVARTANHRAAVHLHRCGIDSDVLHLLS